MQDLKLGAGEDPTLNNPITPTTLQSPQRPPQSEDHLILAQWRLEVTWTAMEA